MPLDGALADLNKAQRLAGEFGSLSPSGEIFINPRLIGLHARLGGTARAAGMIAAARERALRPASPETAILLDAREAALRVRAGEPASRPGHASWSARCGARSVSNSATGRGRKEALGRAYAAAVDSGDMPIGATVAVAVAGLAALYGRHREAAVLLGAAARLRRAHDRTDPQVRALSSRSRAALGDERFAAAHEAGRRLDAAAALARTDPRGTREGRGWSRGRRWPAGPPVTRPRALLTGNDRRTTGGPVLPAGAKAAPSFRLPRAAHSPSVD